MLPAARLGGMTRTLSDDRCVACSVLSCLKYSAHALFQYAAQQQVACHAALLTRVYATYCQGKRRTLEECRQRYQVLLQAFRGGGAHTPPAAEPSPRNGCGGAAVHMRLKKQLMRVMKAHGACQPQARSACFLL